MRLLNSLLFCMHVSSSFSSFRCKFRPWLLAARPKTLMASAAPVMVASALAWHAGVFEPVAAGLCLVFAMLCQIGANWVNDLADYRRGADHAGRIGPQRMVSSGHITPEVMQRAVVGIFAIAFMVGCGLIPFGGLKLLYIGVASVIAACLYSAGSKPLAYIGLGDVVDFIFFGFVATVGTYYVQAEAFPAPVWIAALGVGCMINNILLINNARDVDSDRPVGKRTLVVRFGRTFAFFFYRTCGLLALAVGPILWSRFGYNWTILLPLALYPQMWRLQRRLLTAKTPEEWSTVFEGTAKLVLFYSLLLAVGIVL